MPLGLVHITRFTAEYNLKNNDSIWTVKILIKAGSVADLFCGYFTYLFYCSHNVIFSSIKNTLKRLMFANEGLSKHENWGKQPETKKSGVRKNNQG